MPRAIRLSHVLVSLYHCEVSSIVAAVIENVISSHSLSSILQDNFDQIQVFNSITNFYLEIFPELFY